MITLDWGNKSPTQAADREGCSHDERLTRSDVRRDLGVRDLGKGHRRRCGQWVLPLLAGLDTYDVVAGVQHPGHWTPIDGVETR